jgi:NADPH-dependent 2,4-dienoyl-CoA reductase/sulfur reductase-like enzyme
MPTAQYRYLILGGGMVAGYAAKEFVEHGLRSGELGIVSADTALPYERPPLSKTFLAGKDTPSTILINPDSFYRDHGIGTHLSTRVMSVDLRRKQLRTEDGGEFSFDKLVIATGARVRSLDTPGAKLSNIFYLRSIADSERIRDAMKQSKHAVVIGSGFIGMEVASQCAQHGIDTTMVFPEDRIWKRLFTPEMSAFFRNYYEARHVRFVPGATVSQFSGQDRVEAVALSTGEKITADLVIAGIGVMPETELLKGTDIRIENGIVVNKFLETNVPDVSAAGDVAKYPDILFGKDRRVEHWDNAVKQGQYIARRLTGGSEPFTNVPYFFSDIFDLSYEYWGDQDGAEQVAYRGSLTEPSFSAWWLKGERLVAAFVMSRPDEERELAQKWIAEKTKVSVSELKNAASLNAGR